MDQLRTKRAVLSGPVALRVADWSESPWSCFLAVSAGAVAAMVALLVMGAEQWSKLMLHLLDRASGTATVGFMLVALILFTRKSAPTQSGSCTTVDVARYLWRLASAAAIVWWVAAIGRLWTEYDSRTSVPTLNGLSMFATTDESGKNFATQILIISLMTVLVQYGERGRLQAAALTLLAIEALLPAAVASAEPYGWSAMWLRACHVVPVVIWVGGLAGIVIASRRINPTLPHLLETTRIYSDIALGASVSVCVSGIAMAASWASGHSWVALLDSPAGWVILMKVLCLLALLAAGAAHRLRTIRNMERDGEPRQMTRLALVELIVMGAAVALSVGLTSGHLPAG